MLVSMNIYVYKKTYYMFIVLRFHCHHEIYDDGQASHMRNQCVNFLSVVYYANITYTYEYVGLCVCECICGGRKQRHILKLTISINHTRSTWISIEFICSRILSAVLFFSLTHSLFPSIELKKFK